MEKRRIKEMKRHRAKEKTGPGHAASNTAAGRLGVDHRHAEH